MLTISSHKGNANQNHTKIPCHLLEYWSLKHHQQHVLLMTLGKRNPHTMLVAIKDGATSLEKNLEAS
jgi:hypothetical protein